MNYADKSKEFSETLDAPTLFIRFADSLTSHDRPLLKPETTSEFDYEGELAVIIGKPAHQVKADQALEYVAGYTVLWMRRYVICSLLGSPPGKTGRRLAASGCG